MKFRSLLAVAVASLVSLGGVAEAQYRWVAAEPKALVPEPAPGPIEPKALIEEVLELSGAKKQVLQIPAVVRSQLSERQGG